MQAFLCSATVLCLLDSSGADRLPRRSLTAAAPRSIFLVLDRKWAIPNAKTVLPFLDLSLPFLVPFLDLSLPFHCLSLTFPCAFHCLHCAFPPAFRCCGRWAWPSFGSTSYNKKRPTISHESCHPADPSSVLFMTHSSIAGLFPSQGAVRRGAEEDCRWALAPAAGDDARPLPFCCASAALFSPRQRLHIVVLRAACFF